jgi:curved DNA-binding protein CbpA
MNESEFVDYYELLQLHPNADSDSIERMFRHFAKKFHPDNAEFADIQRFRQIVDAHRTLADAECRAGYDTKYHDYWNNKWGIAAEASSSTAFGDDKVIRERLLSLLYVQRRRDMLSPGMGDAELCRLLRLPQELIEFHMWYLKAKGWVERLDTGLMAITAAGVDQVEESRLKLCPDHLLAEHAGQQADEGHLLERD